jgi:F-type H+-transporting ATPase subunit b
VLIDWFTVGAQAVNFAVLAWLLKRLLYKPILDAIDARERRVAKELSDADEARALAERERAEFRRRNSELEAQHADLMARAIREAKAEGERLLGQARQAADELSARRRDALLSDVRDLEHSLERRVQEEVFSIVRKVLADLTGASLEERMTAEFARRLRALDGAARAALAEAIRRSGEPALIRSAFELPAEQREAIRRALEELAASPAALRFETGPEVVSGIELRADGQKLAWSMAEYLHQLEQRLFEVIADHAKEPPRTGGKLSAGGEPGA